MKIGPKYKISRRLGAPIFSKCQSPKFLASVARHEKASKSKRPRSAMSIFGQQLLEKQKIRFSYGITEKQLSNYVKQAGAKAGVSPKEYFSELLEKRLDNVLFRLGFSPSRRGARQMVSHGHFLVNGKKTKVPSLSVKSGDVIEVREGSRTNGNIAKWKEEKEIQLPSWLSLNKDAWTAKVIGNPDKGEEALDFGAVLEFYSR